MTPRAAPTTSEVALPVDLAFDRMVDALRSTLEEADLRDIDAIVAIARGGVVAGALAAFQSRVPLRVRAPALARRRRPARRDLSRGSISRCRAEAHGRCTTSRAPDGSAGVAPRGGTGR